MAYKEQAPGIYAGRLADFGDAKLDALASAVKQRKVIVHDEVPTRCPGCGNIRLCYRVHCACICQECHDDITRRAARVPGMVY